jgi:uncharacterized glyoxalase superfamily protein PhnB
MRQNRSIPTATVIPELGYDGVHAAATWLCERFGFEKRLSIADHRVQLSFGEGAIVVTERRGKEDGVDLAHSVLVRVDDVDQHYARALAQGVKIIRTPESYPFGERQYTASDIGGHVWTFSQTIADIDPQSWGGVLHKP